MNKEMKLAHLVFAGAVAAAIGWGFLASAASADAAEGMWRQLLPRKKVESDPKVDYSLGENNGPWHVLAASFSGAEGERDARELVQELRSRYNLPAYYYGKTFERDDPNGGLGVDVYGGKIKRRYQSGPTGLEHAVLVGDFMQIDDPEAKQVLEQIKSLEPQALQTTEGEKSTQSMATVREFYRNLKQQIGKPTVKGPMSHAFITRNPLLPAEYFTGGGVDAEVAKWNEGLEFSALHCPAKYTIRVATFTGHSTLSGGGGSIDAKPRTRLAKEDDPLVVAGQNAHKLTVALREKGWEAYEFHDRRESTVTVGSFADMQRLADGRLAPATREAQTIIDTFGAASGSSGFDRPSYEALGMKAAEIEQVERKQQQIMEQFNSQFAAGKGQAASGFNPKGFVGLPFDIIPQAIAAPRKSIGAQYVRN